jgi:hypothetical protein
MTILFSILEYGVATGNINANEQAIHTLIIMYNGWMFKPID